MLSTVALRDLEKLQSELDKVLEKTIKPVLKEHDELRGQQSDRSNKLSSRFVHAGSPTASQLPGH